MKNYQQVTGIKSAADALSSAAAVLSTAVNIAGTPKPTAGADIRAAADVLHAALAALTVATSATQMAQMYYDYVLNTAYQSEQQQNRIPYYTNRENAPAPPQPPVSQGVNVSIIGQQSNNAPEFVRRAIANTAAKSDETAFDRQGQKVKMANNINDALNQLGEDTSQYHQSKKGENEPVIQGYQEWKPKNHGAFMEHLKKKKKS